MIVSPLFYYVGITAPSAYSWGEKDDALPLGTAGLNEGDC
jgi:hypothetical protein